MEDIQPNPVTPVKQSAPINTLQQATPPPSYTRKIMIKVPQHHDEDVSLTPLSPTPVTTTPGGILPKKRLRRFNQYFSAKQERQPSKNYLAKFTDPEERRKKVLNMVHSMYPSDEVFHAARHPLYDVEEHGYYDEFITGYMYEGTWNGYDEDYEYEDDPMHGRDVWEPRIGDDGIDTQEDLDMVLAMREQYNRFHTNISVTKMAHHEASRLAQERDPDGYYQNPGSESEPESKIQHLVFEGAKKNRDAPPVVWPLMLVRSESNAHHIVPEHAPPIELSTHERARLRRLEAKRDAGLAAVVAQEEALWHERKWRQGDLVWRDRDGRVARERHMRELQAHLDRAKSYWYRELRRPKTKTETETSTKIITLTIRPDDDDGTGKPTTANTPSHSHSHSPSPSPSPSKRGRGRGRGRARRNGNAGPSSTRGKRRGRAGPSAPDAAYDPSFDGGDSSGDEKKPSRRYRGAARARTRGRKKQQRMGTGTGTDGAFDGDGDGDVVMAEEESGGSSSSEA
ncbi:hypothetical protein F5X96DRAFT_685685 [Biscogniauxia mediterranea]|nr:hypothetical protein F5X96DRAFT_685685 [Biscogniauxia mediterranea]